MAGKSLRFAIALVLIIVDFIIDVMLFTRSGERTIKPTDRVAFPRELKERLHEKQERRCMYCGVQGGNLEVPDRPYGPCRSRWKQ